MSRIFFSTTSANASQTRRAGLKRSASTGAAILMLSIGVAPINAQAQDVSGAARELPQQRRDLFLVGIGVLAAPTYQGSDEYRILPLPMVDIVKGPFFANLRNGVGINVVDTDTFTVGGSVAAMPGYRRRDVPDGIGRVSVGAGGRLFATVKAKGAVVTLGGTQGFVGGTRGFIADASIAYPIVASPRMLVIPSIGTTWADAKHNDRYFGVSRREAAASGLPRFRLGEDFKDVTAGVTTTYRLSARMYLTASVNVSALVGDARRSPLVEKDVQPSGLLSFTHVFGQ